MDPITDLPPTIEPAGHIAHAANPTPLTHPPNHDHPPYAEMIAAAISALKDKNGSSRQAIAKYIEKVYTNLPPTHSALLTHNLKKLKNNGQLVMIKHSYALPGSLPFPITEPNPNPNPTQNFPTTTTENVVPSFPKRKPGRPPKPRPDFQIPVQQDELVPYVPVAGPEFQAQVHNLAGADPIFVSLGLDDAPAPAGQVPPQTMVVAKRGRGRPPKNFDGTVAVASSGPGKRGRGRPARPKLLSVLMGNGVGGGPKKKDRGRPKRIVPVIVPLSSGGSVQRSRGRPRKGGSYGGGSVASRPGRGIRKLSGKPLGRPKKGAPGTAVLVTDPQQLVAYQELKTKLEHFQSKIKETVSVVKPRLNPEYEAIALGALQELEALATMDVTAPLHIQVQQPQPYPSTFNSSGTEGQEILSGF